MRRILTLVLTFALTVSLLSCGRSPERVLTAQAADEPTATTTTASSVEVQSLLATAERHKSDAQRQAILEAWLADELAARTTTTTAAPSTTTSTTSPPVAPAPPAATPATPSGGGVIVAGIEVCNGADLPTCAIVKRESGFNPTARNPSSSAAGLYQFLDSTFRSVCPAAAASYGSAANAPVSVQVECARILWDGGRGASHWGF